MAFRKEVLAFCLSVEGETEKLYFDWLSRAINESGKAAYDVKIKASVQQSPAKYAKGLTDLTTREVFHVCDMESQEQMHVDKFYRVLTEMRRASKDKRIDYKLGYSNYSFELWMVLHKKDCWGSLSNRTQYLEQINKAFGEKFENLDQYKSADAFQRCLKKITLNDVASAVRRAEKMSQVNKENKQLVKYQGYQFYKDNPSLSIWEVVKKILDDSKWENG